MKATVALKRHIIKLLKDREEADEAIKKLMPGVPPRYRASLFKAARALPAPEENSSESE